MRLLVCAGWTALLLALALPAGAQPKTGGSWAWRPIFTHEGVAFSYLFYREAADGSTRGNGVVIRLDNRNDYAVDYRFEVIFRAEGDERIEEAEGRLGALASKTGSADGLFWVPFPDGRSVAEVGLRGYRITRVQSSKFKVQSLREDPLNFEP